MAAALGGRRRVPYCTAGGGRRGAWENTILSQICCDRQDEKCGRVGALSNVRPSSRVETPIPGTNGTAENGRTGGVGAVWATGIPHTIHADANASSYLVKLYEESSSYVEREETWAHQATMLSKRPDRLQVGETARRPQHSNGSLRSRVSESFLRTQSRRSSLRGAAAWGSLPPHPPAAVAARPGSQRAARGGHILGMDDEQQNAASSSDSGSGSPTGGNSPAQRRRTCVRKAATTDALPEQFSGFDTNGVFHPPGRIRQPTARVALRAATFPYPPAGGAGGGSSSSKQLSSAATSQCVRLKALPLVRTVHITEDSDLTALCEKLFSEVPREVLDEPEQMR